MAKYDFMGDAKAVAQVNTITVGGTPANGQVYSVVINGRTVSYTANGGDTNNTIATALEAALEAETAQEFADAEVGWTVATNVVTGTAGTPGKPFTNTSSATGTGTLVTATTTANDGPNVWSANNFRNIATGARGVLPGGAADDEVYIQDKGVSILYGLDQSGIANPLLILQIAKTFTGRIGLSRTNSDNASATYDEYRPTYLKIKCSHARIGWGEGTGSGRIKIDFAATACKVKVYGSGVPFDQYPSIMLLGTAAGNIFEALGGNVGIAVDEGTVSTFDQIWATGTAIVRTGAGVTLGHVNATQASRVTLNWRTTGFSNLYITDTAEVTLYGGVSADGSTARTMNEIYLRSKGVLRLNCEAGTTADMFIGSSATLDCRGGPSQIAATVVNVFTVTNEAVAMAGNTTDGLTVIQDPGKRVFWQAGLRLDGKLKGFDLDAGTPVLLFNGGGSLS